MIDVNLVTWPNHPRRIEYFRRTVGLLHERLSAWACPIAWRCSSDSEHDPAASWHGEELQALCDAAEINLSWRNGPAGLGENMNAAARLGVNPYVLLVQDDFELRYPLDLAPGVRLLRDHPEVDLIRYGWPGHMTKTLPSPENDIDGWKRVAIPGHWPYGDEPQLRRRSFHDKWGPYVEEGIHGHSESQMLHKLVHGNAVIVLADKLYFHNFGAVSAVIDDHRDREVRR